MKKILIRISGPAAVGKSLLQDKLASLLEAEGHKVNCSIWMNSRNHPWRGGRGIEFVEPREIDIVECSDDAAVKGSAAQKAKTAKGGSGPRPDSIEYTATCPECRKSQTYMSELPIVGVNKKCVNCGEFTAHTVQRV